MKAKLVKKLGEAEGTRLAKVAYDRVLWHQTQKTKSTITLTMWYTIVNHKENAQWDFRAKNHNPDGTWDCGLGQVNMKRCTEESFDPREGIIASIDILAHKNLKFANKDIWMTFKRYNGGGAKATEYANVCMRFYNQYMKGA